MSSHNLLKMDLPVKLPYFSTTTQDRTWPKNFLASEKQTDQYMLSSSDKPAWLGKEHLIFNQNIDKVIYDRESEIFSVYDTSTRLIATVRNNMKAEIINF